MFRPVGRCGPRRTGANRSPPATTSEPGRPTSCAVGPFRSSVSTSGGTACDSGGWGSSGDEITNIGLAHGDPYDPVAILVRIDTWSLAGPMAAMTVANAAQGLGRHLWDEGGAPHTLVRPTWTSDDPTETWNTLEFAVDGAPAAFRALGSGALWVALAEIGNTLVALEARHIKPANVGLVTIDDVEPYLGDGPTPR